MNENIYSTPLNVEYLANAFIIKHQYIDARKGVVQ